MLHSHQSALNGERSSYEVLYGGYVYKAYVEPMYDENEEINGVIGVAYDITEQKQLEARYAERVKELQLLNTFSELNIKYGFDTEKLMQKLVVEMPEGFRWPESTSVKLQLQEKEFTSHEFSGFEHLLSEKIQVYGEDYGLITVYVDSEAVPSDASPFQAEERDLLKNIAERISRVIEHKLRNEELREQTRHLEAIFENASDLIVVLDNKGRYVQLNKANEEITGYTQDELLGMSATEVMDEESRQRFQGLWDDFLEKGEAVGELNVKHKNGEVHTVEYTAAAQILPNKNLVLGRDITERKKYENDLERSLREREVLIQEIHHRVKNNLQIIISMLNLQNAGISDDTSRQSLEEAKGRIYSIALAYEKLHFTKNLELVQMQEYFRDLVGELAHDVVENTSIKVDAEPLFFNINSAVLSGIIVNELIMNSVKHAFTQGMAGTVDIILHKESDGEVLLAVQDNGQGISLDINELPPHSLGMRLVDTLAHQLDGKVVFDGQDGTKVSVLLPASTALEEDPV